MRRRLAEPSMLLILMQFFQAACSRHNPPAFTTSSMQSGVALLGEDVHFKCTVEHLGRHTIFAGPKGKYELTSREGVLKNQWILTIKNAQADDKSNYTCQVNTEPILVKTAELHLRVPPSVSRDTPSAVEVREGQNVTLSCLARGNPEPTVIWRRHDRQIIRYHGTGGFGSSVYHGPYLTLSSVSRKHMSEYVCVASNGIPPDESWTIKLLVTFPPLVLAKSQVVTAQIGQVARIVCDVEAWPRPDVTWYKDGSSLYDNNQYASQQTVSGQFNTVHIMEIRHVDRRSYGRYRCLAKNDNGVHQADVELAETEEDAKYANLILREGPEGSGDDSEIGDSESESESDSNRVATLATTQLPPTTTARSKSTTQRVFLYHNRTTARTSIPHLQAPSNGRELTQLVSSSSTIYPKEILQLPFFILSLAIGFGENLIFA